MTTEPETLTRLLADRVGDGEQLMTYRAFERKAIDPKSGYRPSRSTLWKIRNGEPIKIDERIVGAVAAGLGLDLLRVQAAAAYQYTGFVASDVAGGVAVHELGRKPGPRAAEAIAGWDKEEAERGNHPQG